MSDSDDAARYRWIKSRAALVLRTERPMAWARPDGSTYTPTHSMVAMGVTYGPHESLDQMIDAAMTEHQGDAAPGDVAALEIAARSWRREAEIEAAEVARLREQLARIAALVEGVRDANAEAQDTTLVTTPAQQRAWAALLTALEDES